MIEIKLDDEDNEYDILNYEDTKGYGTLMNTTKPTLTVFMIYNKCSNKFQILRHKHKSNKFLPVCFIPDIYE